MQSGRLLHTVYRSTTVSVVDRTDSVKRSECSQVNCSIQFTGVLQCQWWTEQTVVRGLSAVRSTAPYSLQEYYSVSGGQNRLW